MSNRMLSLTLKTFSDDGKAIIYSRGSNSVELSKAVFDKNAIVVDPGTGVSVNTANPTIGVALVDLPGGEAKNGDQVSIDGVLYYVKDHQEDSEGHCKILLVKK